MNKKIIFGLILLVVFGISFFLFSKPKLEVLNPHIGQAIEAVYSTGTVEGSGMYSVSSQSPAKLIELLVDEGDKVVSGQILARLEDGEYVGTLNQLKARESLALEQYKRQEKLFKDKIISQDEFQRFKAEWLAAKATTSAAQSRLDYLTLRSMSDGTIIKRDGEIGELIQANQEVFWIAATDQLRVSSIVDEEDISKVKVGQAVKFQADAFGERVFDGVVQQITLKGDPISRTYRVRIGFKNADIPLMIGMTVESNIIVKEVENALLIPKTALVNDFVWVLENKQIKKKIVKIGVEGVQEIEVIDGLSEEDLVVVKSDEKIIENQKYTPILIDPEKK